MRRLTAPKLPPIRDTVIFPILAAVIGIIEAGLLLGWRQINPGNVSWLKGDPAVSQVGWEFLRNEPWRFPPTWLPHLDYPFGISAAYLDVIPLVAVPLKLTSHFLPLQFQYLGLYALLCLVLQGYAAFRLMSRFSSDNVAILIGTLFFLVSPVFLMRFYGHFALCSQWLILAALYCYFRPTGDPPARYLWPFAALLALSAGITPYLAMMVLGVAIAALGRLWLGTNNPGAMYLLAVIPPLLLSLTLSWYVFGFVSSESMPSIDSAGYGFYSMNLVGPINPSGTSLFLRTLPVFPLQLYEGYNYLGDGIIALTILCLAMQPSLAIELWRRPLRPLLIMSLVFFFLALSTVITFEHAVVASVVLPARLTHLLAAFRSSGRFFWPVHYLISLGALAGTLATIKSRFATRMVLCAALALQIAYVLPIMKSVAQRSAETISTPLLAKDWQTLGNSNKHLVIIPAWQCNWMGTPGGDAAWPWFARMALTSGMTLNSVHAARASLASQNYNCRELPRQIGRGRFQRSTAYVLYDWTARSAIAHDAALFCRRVDGFNLCTVDPRNASRARSLGAQPGAKK